MTVVIDTITIPNNTNNYFKYDSLIRLKKHHSAWRLLCLDNSQRFRIKDTVMIGKINFDKMGGLVPVVIQDNHTLQVLMVGFMNEEALHLTLSSNKVTFFSRTKNRIWQKGETSGNFLHVIDMHIDCDNDSILIREQHNVEYKYDIVIKTGIGVYLHVSGTLPLILNNNININEWNKFIIYNSVGLLMDGFAIIKLIKYKKWKYENGFSKTSYR